MWLSSDSIFAQVRSFIHVYETQSEKDSWIKLNYHEVFSEGEAASISLTHDVGTSSKSSR